MAYIYGDEAFPAPDVTETEAEQLRTRLAELQNRLDIEQAACSKLELYCGDLEDRLQELQRTCDIQSAQLEIVRLFLGKER